MNQIFVTAAAVVGFALAAPKLVNLYQGTTTENVNSVSARSKGPKTAVGYRNAGGQFDFNSNMNGIHVNVLVDTGASSVTINQSTARRIGINVSNNDFHNFSALIGLNYQALKTLKIALNVGYATRNPSINELYSNGLHQGVSGIEEGDVGLKIEQALKTTLGIDWNFKETFFIEALLYHQWINNYIYLNPQEEIRLTIRGAFPVYKYQQSLAQIYGLDLSATYNVTKKLSIKAQYAYLRGDDLGNQIPLVAMPANNLFAKISYAFPKVGSFNNLAFELHNKYVFRQNNLLPSQDFTPVPNAYNLLGLSCSIERNIKNVHLKIYARIDNLLNTKYRDYLNRQRYFADALGINGTIGLSLTF